MEIREIFDTIESDPCMDKDLQKDILEKSKFIFQQCHFLLIKKK